MHNNTNTIATTNTSFLNVLISSNDKTGTPRNISSSNSNNADGAAFMPEPIMRAAGGSDQSSAE